MERESESQREKERHLQDEARGSGLLLVDKALDQLLLLTWLEGQENHTNMPQFVSWKLTNFSEVPPLKEGEV